MKRSELYGMVWSEPVTHVARSLGVSPTTLSGACRRLNVPLPPRGHWRKIQTGQVVERTELANPSDDPAIELEQQRIVRHYDTVSAGDDELKTASNHEAVPQRPLHGGGSTGSLFEQNAAALIEADRAIEMSKALARTQGLRELLNAVKAGASKEGKAVAAIAARWGEQVECVIDMMDPVQTLLQEWVATTLVVANQRGGSVRLSTL